MQGIVKWFNPGKGFGFIASEGKDYFVHYKHIVSQQNYKELKDGQLVTFVPSSSAKGLTAESVCVLEP